ncbi:ATP-binding protein [Nocardia sp. CDC160]|uniref:ATP-binding protein n=1 Tax=Nocardia sp. CDC160 TaxID=3112166 RepID=UPI002DBE0CEA|nr:ATP-binding protein [Nocardia sp. CDC160]MEC3913127.1 ATP-binding protein [Nocardia sp. CDC160]
MLGGREITWERVERQGCSVVYPHGELTSAAYRAFTDALVKFAVEEPRAVIVVLDNLRVASEPLYSAFGSAWMRVGEWPGVPIVLIVHSPSRRQWLRGSAVHRFVPVHADLVSALAGLREAPSRRRATLDLAPTADCGQRARHFVEETCLRWGIPEVRVDALLVATELVENSFLHSDVPADIQVRLELRNQLFTVAVGDADPREALLREPGTDGPRHYGLHLVARISRSWGCAPRWPSGKIVWAVLPTGRRRDLRDFLGLRPQH